MDRIELVVRATDRGTPPLSSTARLSLTVGDANDNAPRFLTRNPVVYLAANSSSSSSTPSSPVYVLLASDADSGLNGQVTFSLLTTSSVPPGGAGGGSSGPPFSLSRDGVLSVTGELSQASTPRYRLLVRASDNGYPALATFTTLTIVLV